MSERDKIKKLFTQEPPFDKRLEKIFGGVYLDYPDLSGQVPDTIREAAGSIGEEVCNISELVANAIKEAKPISCEINQRLLRRAIEGYISSTETISWEESWVIRAHMRDCGNKVCYELDRIATLDNRITPEHMRVLYEWVRASNK